MKSIPFGGLGSNPSHVDIISSFYSFFFWFSRLFFVFYFSPSDTNVLRMVRINAQIS